MKRLQTFITLAIGMVFPCLATTYTSASYVQDGDFPLTSATVETPVAQVRSPSLTSLSSE